MALEWEVRLQQANPRVEASQWLGLVWGIAAAFWELYKTSQRLIRWDEADTRRLEEERRHGQD